MVAFKFGLSNYLEVYIMHEYVKAADYEALVYEWGNIVIADKKENGTLRPHEAEKMFLEIFQELTHTHPELEAAKLDMGLLDIAHKQNIKQIEVCEQVLADTHTELDKAKQTVAELHVVIAEFRKSAEATEAELDTVKAELGRGKWVSVSEPPKSNGKYLVWDVNGLFDDKNELATYVVYNDHWYNESNDMSIHPTHWQPLPTQPHKN